LNKDENTGASMGANYEGKIGKWDVQSINSFATKSYAGIKRGSFSQISESAVSFLILSVLLYNIRIRR
jgi:hypothetical protein